MCAPIVARVTYMQVTITHGEIRKGIRTPVFVIVNTIYIQLYSFWFLQKLSALTLSNQVRTSYINIYDIYLNMCCNMYIIFYNISKNVKYLKRIFKT